MVERRTIGGDEGWRMQLKREAVGLGHVTLGQLNMTQGIVGRFLGALGEGQVLRQLGVGKTHAALCGDVRPELGDARTDVRAALPGECELAGFGVRQLRNPLREHDLEEAPKRADGEDEDEEDENDTGPQDAPPSRSEYPARWRRFWQGHA